MAKILVTGGSGFVGGHVILQLLAAGHDVRATVRDIGRAATTRIALAAEHGSPGDRLSFVGADLTGDAGWGKAAAGRDYVMHVASPFPTRVPKDENELIVPAREGTLRVLRAARDAGVKRVVLTSSFAAIGYGHKPRERPFDETDWTDIEGKDTQPYMKSKTIAERAAWDFIAREGGGMELAAVNPVSIFGPVLGSHLSSSVELVRAMLEGRMPGSPRLYFGVVDVRDVADLHLRAMTDPKAAGERFLAQSGPSFSLQQVANVLHERLGRAARKAPKRELPNWLLGMFALLNPDAAAAAPHLGRDRPTNAEKAKRVLGWSPRPPEEAIAATGESLLAKGLIRQRRRRTARARRA